MTSRNSAPAEHRPRVTILTANSGGGHRAAAQSLTEALAGQADVALLNLLDEHAPFPFNTWSAIYGPAVNYAPAVYSLIYRYAANRRRMERTARAVYPLVRRALTGPLLAHPADLFISVHPLQVDVPLHILHRAGRGTPFVVVVTDPVTPPVAWFNPQADLTIVATEQARQSALACGLAPERVHVIGLPIRRAFAEARDRPKPAARALVSLAADRPLLLLMGGGAGIGRLLPIARALAKRLAAHPAQPQVALIAGRNPELQRQLAAERWPMPVQTLGFVDNMADWLAAADLLITKAGPGSLAEAACLGVPAIISDFIPGQEAGNVAWFEGHGAGLYEPHPEGIARLADDLLRPENPALAEMATHARALSRPHAAAEIAQAALSLIDAGGST